MFEAFNDPQWSSYHWDDMSEYNQVRCVSELYCLTAQGITWGIGY